MSYDENDPLMRRRERMYDEKVALAETRMRSPEPSDEPKITRLPDSDARAIRAKEAGRAIIPGRWPNLAMGEKVIVTKENGQQYVMSVWSYKRGQTTLRNLGELAPLQDDSTTVVGETDL